ncbi:MCE family protein [bacterium]|nr:MCE family protein [bacterium]
MFKDDREKRKILKKVHSAELLIWLLVVFAIISFVSLGAVVKDIKSDNDYQIFLSDADGLIVGSPVRMMGVEVGHVIKIKPLQDEVYVKFLLTNPDIVIPQGTGVTVEFSGMAGSKSLELYLPDKNTVVDNETSILIVSSPKRLHDALDLLDTMYKKITSIIYSVSYFSSEINDLNSSSGDKIKSGADFSELIDYSESFIENSYKREKSVAKFIERFSHEK